MSNFSNLNFVLQNTGDNNFTFGSNAVYFFGIFFNNATAASEFVTEYNSGTNSIVSINSINITTGAAVINPNNSNIVNIQGSVTQIGPISYYINIVTREFKYPIDFGPNGVFGSINISNMGYQNYGTVLNNFVSTPSYYMYVESEDNGGYEQILEPMGGRVVALATPLTLACLLKGTKILTPAGEILIEHLKINDTVLTADNREVKIMDIYSSLASSQDNLYVIHKDTISCGIPNEDLFVSGGHRVKIDGKFYHPFHNKTNLIEKCSENKTVQFYHVKLENYLTDFLVANGVEVESLGDTENPDHTNWDCSGEECKLVA
jgi:hypothetical protein